MELSSKLFPHEIGPHRHRLSNSKFDSKNFSKKLLMLLRLINSAASWRNPDREGFTIELVALLLVTS